MGPYRGIILSISVLFCLSVAVLIYDSSSQAHERTEKIKAFQQYVCGFGLGASVNPKWGFLNFDPRIDPVDETALFPVPGIYSYSPDRGASVVDINEIIPFDKKEEESL